MDLIILRHARPVAEVRPDGQGTADPPLAPIGVEQAAATAELLANWKIDHIVSSTMRRAVETAQPLADRLGLPVEEIDDLKEADHYRDRYTPVEEMGRDDPIIVDYLADPQSIFGGDYDGFRSRVTSAFDRIVDGHRGQTVAVFCHGMVMGVFLQTMLGHDNPLALHSDYCGIMRVTASAKGFRTVRSVNETGHVRHLLDQKRDATSRPDVSGRP